MRILSEKVRQFYAQMQQTLQLDLNFMGSQRVHIAILPPRFEADVLDLPPTIVLVNGHDMVPLKWAWAMLLYEFMRQHQLHPLGELNLLINRTVDTMKQIFVKQSRKRLRKDLWVIMQTLYDIGVGERHSVDVGYVSMTDYVASMRAPLRLELLLDEPRLGQFWHCGKQCRLVAQSKSQTRRPLSVAEWRHMIEHCHEIGIPCLTFVSHNLPTTTILAELVEAVRWFWTEAELEAACLNPELCARLHKAELGQISLTLYSDHAEVYNRMAGWQCFREAIAGITSAVRAELNVLAQIPLQGSKHDCLETINLAIQLGVKRIACFKAGDFAGAELDKTLAEIVQLCAQHDVEINWAAPGQIDVANLVKFDLTVPVCGACLGKMSVLPTGKIVPCRHWPTNQADLGYFWRDSGFAKPWQEIWNNEACVMTRQTSARLANFCQLKEGEST